MARVASIAVWKLHPLLPRRKENCEAVHEAGGDHGGELSPEHRRDRLSHNRGRLKVRVRPRRLTASRYGRSTISHFCLA